MRFGAFLFAFCALAADGGFDTAETCKLCHSRIGDHGQYTLWKTTVMAHAAVDPIWKAQVAREPGPTDKCITCHSPAREHKVAANEGITCTVCRQISPEFAIKPAGLLYGPHEKPFSMPMEHHTDYKPAFGKQMLDSALCATCHSQRTANGFLEQSPYEEWLDSAAALEGRSCQSCHVPPLDKPEYIAHRPPGGPFPPTSPRTPFGRHSFRGANVALLTKLNQPEAAAATREFLATSCDLTLEGTLTVTVVNRTGHKLPTGFPTRRLTLRVTATDAAGKSVLEREHTWAAKMDSPYLTRATRFVSDTRIPPRGPKYNGTDTVRFDLPKEAVAASATLVYNGGLPGMEDVIVKSVRRTLR